MCVRVPKSVFVDLSRCLPCRSTYLCIYLDLSIYLSVYISYIYTHTCRDRGIIDKEAHLNIHMCVCVHACVPTRVVLDLFDICQGHVHILTALHAGMHL